MSADGRFVAFTSTASNLAGGPDLPCANGWVGIVGCSWVYVRDLATGTTSVVNIATDGMPSTQGTLDGAAISGDARFVAFADFAADLVPGDTNGNADIFVRGPLR